MSEGSKMNDGGENDKTRFESANKLFESLTQRCMESVFYLCRGETRLHDGCKPLIARNDLEEFQLINGEAYLIAQFRQRAGTHMSENELILSKTIWGTQMLMKHYGAPTRLLDWTYSPFVALYFACETNFQEDGYLNMYGVDGIRKYSYESNEKRGIPMRLKPPRLDPYFDADKLHEWSVLMSGKIDGETLDSKEEPWLVFNQPSRTTYRVIAQQSVFTFGNPIKQDHNLWLKGHTKKEYTWEYVIPGGIKRKILRVLDKMNINASVLYPDLAGAGKSINRMFQAGIPLIAPVDDWCHRIMNDKD